MRLLGTLIVYASSTVCLTLDVSPNFQENIRNYYPNYFNSFLFILIQTHHHPFIKYVNRHPKHITIQITNSISSLSIPHHLNIQDLHKSINFHIFNFPHLFNITNIYQFIPHKSTSKLNTLPSSYQSNLNIITTNLFHINHHQN